MLADKDLIDKRKMDARCIWASSFWSTTTFYHFSDDRHNNFEEIYLKKLQSIRINLMLISF